MSSIIPHKIQEFITRGSSHQVRIYPKGTRIRSNNYNPAPYWRGGAQICAQNWQRFDKGMQVTRAMFEGTDGWLLKPRALLGEHAREKEREKEGEYENTRRITIGPQRFSCEVLGFSAGTFVYSHYLLLLIENVSSHIVFFLHLYDRRLVPLRKPNPPEEDSAKVYIMAQLFHADGDLTWRSPTVKADFSTPFPPAPSLPSFPSDDGTVDPTTSTTTNTSDHSRDKLDLTLSTEDSRSAFKFTWNFEAGPGDGSGPGGDMSLTFIRFLIVHNIKRERDVKLGVYCVNVAGWRSGAFGL